MHAISQTPDGYLWIGAEKGLVRFDGFGFHLETADETSGMSASPIQQMAADAQGRLWIMQQSMTLSTASITRFGISTAGGELTGASAICRAQNGDILIINRGSGIERRGARSVRVLPIPAALKNVLVISIAETSDGTVWLGTRDAGLAALSKGKLVWYTSELPDRKINVLLAAGSELWVGTDSGLVHRNRERFTANGLPLSVQNAQILSLLMDRFGNLWVGTAKGLERAGEPPSGLAPRREWAATARAGAVNALFEDREGDLWIGTDQGVERLRESAFSGFPSTAGLKRGENGPVFVDREGRTWFAGPHGGLNWRRGQQEGSVPGLQDDTIYSIYGRGADLWIGRKYGGLSLVRCSAGCEVTRTYTHADGLAENAVFSVFAAESGAVWAGTVSGGVSKLLDNKIFSYTTADGISSNAANVITGSADGTIWLGTPEGLSELTGRRWQRLGAREGLPPGSVNCLALDQSNRLWIGTSKGLAVLVAGRISTFGQAASALRDPVLGLAADRSGSLWVATSRHVLRVKQNSLLGSGGTAVEVREYGPADGLPGGLSIRRDRSLFAGQSGLLWLSTDRGLCVADPARLGSEAVPALVHMQSVSADGIRLPFAAKIEVPPRRRRITLSFVGLSLSVPERIRFRYKLDDFDRDWSEPSLAREAVYTNLSPGTYRFHVLASNASGIWNGAAAGVTLRVEPAFWQAWWFRIAGIFGVGLLAAALYRFRLHQITSELDLRFQERLQERTRIARELHDTLLQGFLSASMQMHVAFGRLDETSAARAPLARAIELMGRAGQEGRAALRQLRSTPAAEPDLEQALSGIPQEVSAPEGIAFHLRVEGRQQQIRPVLRDDVYRICREAILNALRHSRASGIEVEVAYAPHHLRVHVQDNGCGMDPEMIAGGRDGHWGLQGMRERAERIGARLNVLSNPGAGTEIILSVPGHIAFPPPVTAARNRPRWFYFLRPRWRIRKEPAAAAPYDRHPPD